VQSHRAKHRASSVTSPTPGGPPVRPTGARPAGLRHAAVIATAVLVVAAGGAATAIHLRPSDQRPAAAAASDASGASLRAASVSRPTLKHQATTRRYIQRASRSGARPKLATSVRPAASSVDRVSTDGDSSTTVPLVATRQAARRAALLQSASSAAQRFEKTLSSQQWVLPTSGFHISTWFGESGPYWSSGYHTGIDFATACGTPDVAVADATVAQTGWDGPYGNQIRLQFTNGDQVWYNHLSAIEVSTGQNVRQGEQIGRVGETGNAYGCHTHFEYRLASDLHTAVDPLPFFESHGIQLR
jgi:murein DD-endopeptidase MepM/ murein hydrolase activator NlpD